MTLPIVDGLRRDLRDAIRSLRRTPAFTITAILILGLGIGMSSAMFTVFQSVLLKKLPVQDQDRLVELSAVGKGTAAKEFPLNLNQYRRILAQTRTLQAVAGLNYNRVNDYQLNDRDRSFRLHQAVVTGNFFQVLGVAPSLGRVFQPEDEREWHTVHRDGLVIVISYHTWQREFAGDSSVIGRHVQEPTGHEDVVIAGVAAWTRLPARGGLLGCGQRPVWNRCGGPAGP